MNYKVYQYRYNNECQDSGKNLILEDEYGDIYQCVPIDEGMIKDCDYLGNVQIPDQLANE